MLKKFSIKNAVVGYSRPHFSAKNTKNIDVKKYKLNKSVLKKFSVKNISVKNYTAIQNF